MESVVNNILSSWDSISHVATTGTATTTNQNQSQLLSSPTLSQISSISNDSNALKEKKKSSNSDIPRSTSTNSIWSSLTEGNSNNNRKAEQKMKHDRKLSNDSVSKKPVTAGSFFDDLFSTTSNKDGTTQTSSASASYTQQLTDKFFERMLSMALPTTTTNDGNELPKIMSRIENQKSRPQVSINIMSRNSILLLTRLSAPFEMIDEITIIFNWSDPIYTLTFLNVTTLMILKPILLVSLPMFYICFQIIVPAYLKRHPPDKNTIFKNSNPIPSEGPSLQKIDLPKPVPELSREFILNMTDLQNRMMIYIVGYDIVTNLTVKYLYFKDENLTIFIFFILLLIGLLITTFGTSLIVLCLPMIKFITVAILWITTGLFHPYYRDLLLNYIYSEETRLKLLTLTNQLELKLNSELNSREEKQIKELEIYELQTLNPESRNWQLVCFTPDSYASNSHIRLNNIPIEGTTTLSKVKPPKGWKFIDLDSPKALEGWILDLKPNEWIKENYLNELMDIDNDEKWCYDLKIKFNTDLGLGVSLLKKSTKLRGEFRRRRWIRYCIRSIWDENEEESGETSTKNQNQHQHQHHHLLHRNHRRQTSMDSNESYISNGSDE